MDWQNFLKSKMATVGLTAALIVVMIVTSRILIQKYQINKQIKDLQTRSEQLKKDNTDLSGLINYFNTSQYQEQQAREKLNLKKEGEQVVVLRRIDDQQNQTMSTAARGSNPKKWFDYFFSKNP